VGSLQQMSLWVAGSNLSKPAITFSLCFFRKKTVFNNVPLLVYKYARDLDANNYVAWVQLQSKNEGLTKWLPMQCIKENSTLRISSKREKKSPRIVNRWGKQDNQIKKYLEWSKLIKKIDKNRKNAINIKQGK
jgi:hypothetical protein